MRETIRLAALAEAFLFAHGSPVTRGELGAALSVDEEAVAVVLAFLSEKYAREDSGVTLRETGAGLALATKKEFDAWLTETSGAETPLSPAALETLAVIADKEPVTRAEIERVRGVSAGRMLASLMEKDLVEERGRLEVPGRPILYGTTKRFLNCAGLSDVAALREMWAERVTEEKLF